MPLVIAAEYTGNEVPYTIYLVSIMPFMILIKVAYLLYVVRVDRIVYLKSGRAGRDESPGQLLRLGRLHIRRSASSVLLGTQADLKSEPERLCRMDNELRDVVRTCSYRWATMPIENTPKVGWIAR